MNYIITITHGTKYTLTANNLINLFHQVVMLKEKHAYYDDEIVSIKQAGGDEQAGGDNEIVC